MYAALVAESDQRAAGSLGSRMPARPVMAELPPLVDDAQPPYVRIAAALRYAIDTGALAGAALPAVKQIAARYDVSVGTAHRAMARLREEGRVEMVSGRGNCAVAAPPRTDEEASPVETVAPAQDVHQRAMMLDLVLRHRGQVVARFSTEADPHDPDDLADVLAAAVRRTGGQAEDAAEYELDVRRNGGDDLIRTFVVSPRRARR